MKNYKSFLYNRLAEQFSNAKLKGTANVAPRNGYYFVKDVTFRKIGKFTEVPIAIVNWKANENDWFFEDVTFEIALMNIFPPVGDDYGYILGNYIVIYDSQLVVRLKNGKEEQRVSCQWAVAAPSSKFTTSQQAATTAILGQVKSFNEFKTKFEIGLGIDHSNEFIFDGNAYDAPDEDVLDAYDAPADDNAYDAPTDDLEDDSTNTK